MSTQESTYSLILAKEDFKFSSGHFTLFSEHDAELLHGHNYQVGVEFVGRELDEQGLLISFVETKTAIRRLCDELDTQLLIPKDSPHLRFTEQDGHLEIRFRDRRYVVPKADVLLVPEVNTSIEVMARYIWRRLTQELDLSHLDSVGVSVSETAGQFCWYRAPIPKTDP